MYQIHGFGPSFNTTKVLYVAEELGIDYAYSELDLSKGEHKTPEHMRRHPLGKTPTLEHDGRPLFESSAICRYLASVENSALYPASDLFQRAVIDQWIDFHTCHLGRWLGTLLFERVVREKFGMGEKKADVEREAVGFIAEQLTCVNDHLSRNAYLAGDAISIADPFAFAYLETTAMSDVALSDYPHVAKWLDAYQARDSVRRARARLGRT